MKNPRLFDLEKEDTISTPLGGSRKDIGEGAQDKDHNGEKLSQSKSLGQLVEARKKKSKKDVEREMKERNRLEKETTQEESMELVLISLNLQEFQSN